MSNEIKRYSWEWLKEETARALVGIVVLAFVALIGYGILQSFIGDSKLDKAIDGLRKEMVDRHNATVQREAELLHKITTLQQKRNNVSFVPIVPPPEIDGMNPAQVQLDFQKANNEKYSPEKK